jgi:hypothetical protein
VPDFWARADVCHYCGAHYHPMPVYTSAGRQIWVCHHRYTVTDDDVQIDETDCKAKAEADGYVYRRDLTPTR